MSKLNSKGFFIIETLVVIMISVVVLTIFYRQISSLYNNYEQGYHYDTIPSLHAANNIKTFIMEEDFSSLIHDIYEKSHIDITNYVFASPDLFSDLKDTLNVQKIYLTQYDVRDMVKNASKYNFDMLFVNYLKTLRSLEQVNTRDFYRIIIIFNDLTYTSITIDSDDVPIVFVCGTRLLDLRDSKSYATVQIGNQCWFADNLRYTTTQCLNATWNASAPFNACRIHGEVVGDPVIPDWAKGEVSYQWGAAMNGSTTEGAQGLCPTGWHVPSDNDIKIMEMNLNPSLTQSQADSVGWRGTNQGDQLKSSNPSWCNNATGCAASGFNLRPSSSRSDVGTLFSIGTNAYFWSTSPSSPSVFIRHMNSTSSNISRGTGASYASGFPVRCIMSQ